MSDSTESWVADDDIHYETNESDDLKKNDHIHLCAILKSLQ